MTLVSGFAQSPNSFVVTQFVQGFKRRWENSAEPRLPEQIVGGGERPDSVWKHVS